MGRLIVSWVPRPPARLKGRCGAPPRWASAGPSARSARLAHRAPHPRSALAALACPLTRAPGVEGALMRAMEGHRSPIAPSTGERSRCRPSQDLVHAHAICAYRPTDGAGDPNFGDRLWGNSVIRDSVVDSVAHRDKGVGHVSGDSPDREMHCAVGGWVGLRHLVPPALLHRASRCLPQDVTLIVGNENIVTDDGRCRAGLDRWCAA